MTRIKQSMLPVLLAKSSEELLDRSMWWGIGLVFALFVLAWAAYRLRSWYGEDEDHADADQELLAHLKQMRSDGGVSEEEFRNIKGRLSTGLVTPPPPSQDSLGDP
ncbi:MAG: hypothetical protein ACK5Q5_01625 [Planctomycetaceae bacterium]